MAPKTIYNVIYLTSKRLTFFCVRGLLSIYRVSFGITRLNMSRSNMSGYTRSSSTHNSTGMLSGSEYTKRERLKLIQEPESNPSFT